MVDSLSPLPPISARVTKTAVSEKNPHHQNNQQQQEHQKNEEVQDKISIETAEEEVEKDKKPPIAGLLHNIDIEV